jgi:hypothetical protein
MKKYHYTYYSYEEFGRGYIGVRSCNCKPEEDIKYFGSYRDKTFNPTQKIILETYDTAEEATLDEEILHTFYDVKNNSHFANLSNANRKGCHATFNHLSSEQRSMIIKKANASRTPEKRREIAKKAGKTRMSSMTSEQKSQLAIKANSYRTTEERRETSKKVFANWTPEQLSERARKANASMTPEQRSERSRKAQLNRTSEQRSESAKRGKSNMTPHQRSEASKKGSSQRWKCTETGFITSPGSLSNYQKARGIDTSKRVRVS